MQWSHTCSLSDILLCTFGTLELDVCLDSAAPGTGAAAAVLVVGGGAAATGATDGVADAGAGVALAGAAAVFAGDGAAFLASLLALGAIVMEWTMKDNYRNTTE